MSKAEEYLSMQIEDFEKFSTEKILEIIELLELEAQQDNVQQMALKILINSLYGALANQHFLLANPDMAAAITASGRFFVQLLANRVEEKLQELLPWDNKYVIAGDTDSIYLTLKPIVDRKFKDRSEVGTMEVVDWVNNFEDKFIKPLIDSVIKEYGEILNIFDTKQVGVEREIISDRAFFVAKKRYAARVLDSEGVRFELDDPKIKVMGLEIARSSTPPWVKDKLTESISIILDNDEYGVRKWRDETKLQYTSQDIESISATQGISTLDYDIKDKGIPQGVRSALAHNIWVKQNGLEDEIELLQPGEKYKRCYLKTPNRFNTDIISYQSPKIVKIIEEDGIFDYSTNFQKQFEQPLERMIEGMGYNIEDKPHFGNLDDW